MRRLRVIRALPALIAGGLLLTACSSDEERRPAAINAFGSGGSGGAGGTGGTSDGGAAGVGGVSGSAGSSGEAGAGGEGGESECGNGVLEAGEECDGDDLGGETCATLGFDSGQLACTDCEFDYAACVGVERCYDGIDNDGDGALDCEDDDCEPGCADPCTAPIEMEDPATVEAATWTRSDTLASSCVDPADSSGPDMVFELTPANTGVVEAVLTSSADLTLSARSQCLALATELGCSNFALGGSAVERVIALAQAGVPLYLVVDGAAAAQEGAFELKAWSRPIVCGDGERDPGEACDDADTVPGDGCSETCVLESSETEPNDAIANADAVVTRFIGAIDPAGDVDMISVVVENPVSNLVVVARDLGDNACEDELMDPVVEVYKDGSPAPVAADDDSGPGLCSYIAVGSLEPGTYFVSVRAAGGAPSTFPYRLDIEVNWCGDFVTSVVEECDDGNVEPGDGCSATCTWE